MSTTVLGTDLPFARRLGSGKVRDLYQLGDDLLLIATDRVSAFDVVMEEAIPGKGRVLTELSKFWFDHLHDVVPNHLISTDVDAWDDVPDEFRATLRGRTMRCRRAEPLPVEWVVRGYLTGSGYNDYRANRTVSGIELPDGLEHASRIEPAILTPSTKAESGHDEPCSYEEVVELVGSEIASRGREVALELYARGHAYAAERGMIIADTKFEFGLIDGELVLIDECLTPDSSRFWPQAEVSPGSKPTSFDKQVLRNYLLTTEWNREPPPPTLPPEVIETTARTYREIRERLID